MINGVEGIYFRQVFMKDWYDSSKGVHTPLSLLIRYLNSLFQHTMNVFNQFFRSSSRFINIIISLVILTLMTAKQNFKKFPQFEMQYFLLSIIAISIFPYLDIRYTIVSLFSVLLVLMRDSAYENRNKLTIYIYMHLL